MDLAPSSEQEAMVAATADWCRDYLPLGQARNRPAGLWAELEAMGWTAMTAPAMGLDHATEALVFAELGRHLAPVGLLATAVAARWTPHPGKTALALLDRAAPGGMLRVLDPEDAERALGLIGHLAATALLPTDLCGRPSLDPSASLAHLDPPPAFEAIADPRAALHLQLLAAAYAVGSADAARDMAASYALIREQFERPIGWFQALKHICADMAPRGGAGAGAHAARWRARSFVMRLARSMRTTVKPHFTSPAPGSWPTRRRWTTAAPTFRSTAGSA